MLQRLFFLLSVLFFTHHTTQAQIIKLVAGNGTDTGNVLIGGPDIGDGGPATAANFAVLPGVAVDRAGNIYIADNSRSRVRKVNTAGIITTIAGDGTDSQGGDGGPATAAKVGGCSVLTTDAAGNLYIVVANTTGVRRIDPSGIITTVAGCNSATALGDGGPATAAGFQSIYGIATDKTGNLYISDQYSDRVRKVNTAGIISTYAGTGTAGYSGDGGPATAATMHVPRYLATDTMGNLYIGDAGHYCIRKVDTAGIITTIAGNGTNTNTGDGGPATAASLEDPLGMVVDPLGNIYVAAWTYIRKIDTAGVISSIAGDGSTVDGGDDGPATAAGIEVPTALSIDSAGVIYLTTVGYHVRKIVPLALTEGMHTTAATTGSLQLYPNPANGQVMVTITTPTTMPAQLTISNAIGQVIKEQQATTNKQTTITITTPGIYLITATTAAGKWSKEVVMEER